MSDFEQWVLGGLALNDASTFTLESINDPPAQKKPEWVSGADSDGSLLARPPKYDNAVMDLVIRVNPQATMDLALAKIGLILDQLQECEQNANGLALVWTPADGTISVTARAYMGEIVDLPKGWDKDAGWLVKSPLQTVRITRSPFFYGTETLLGSVTSSDPLVTLEVSGVAGDVPALGRLVVTDAASQSRRWMAWGLESRWYPTSSPSSLLIDSTSMTAMGGATATRSGAYNGGSNNVISATLRQQPQPICSLGNLSHVGSFRPQLRYYASALTMGVRLTYQTLDGPFRSLSYDVPVVAGWNHADLGLITIPPTVLGTQKWTGRIEAISTSADGGETFAVDYLSLIPAELFGRARGSYARTDGLLGAYDHFVGTTATAALNARAAPTGGTWATSGATTDFVFTDTPVEAVTRTTTADASPRYGILGSTDYTDIDAAITTRFSAYSGQSQVLIVRWTDASNHLRIIFQTGVYLVVTKVVAGVVTDIKVVSPASGILTALSTWYTLHSVVFASGRGIVWLRDAAGAVILTTSFSDSVLATGGTLATGKPGIADYNNGSANTRLYDNMYVATPPAEPIVCHSGQSIEFRHDTVLREDSTGTYAGVPPEYVGSRFLVPNAGGPARKARVAVMAKRHDVESVADDYIADSTTVAAYATPRYLVVPR